MGLSRKDFLLSSAGLFAMAGGLNRNVFTKFDPAATLNGTRMSILYDSSKCIGCEMCKKACMKENNLPQEEEAEGLSKSCWMTIQATKNDNGQDLFLKRQCMHCTDASCVSVCPTGAAEHHGEYVVIDQDVCIGCGYCEEACPFSVPHRGHPPVAAQKCDFCFDRVSSGSIPNCAKACPIGATTYGARTDLVTTANNKIQNLTKLGWTEAQLYGESELGGLGVMYILLKPPAFYGLSEQPRQATENVLAQWITGSLIAGVLIAPFWYLHRRVSEKDKQSIKQKESTK